MSKTTKEEVLKILQGEDFRERQREIRAIQKDISTARGVIADGIARYKKARLRVRSKKAATENPFADLEGYSSQKDFQDAYDWELISEAEMDRLNALWAAREASLSTSGKYDDRVTQMLERALNVIADEYIDQLTDFQELEGGWSQMLNALPRRTGNGIGSGNMEEVSHMAEKYTFPGPGCSSCQHYQVVGGITRYCNGFKRRKAKCFKKSDPRLKTPRWCPRRLSPPACRIYGFKDECSEYMELMRRMDFELERSKIISPSAGHYKLRTELSLGMTAKRFYDVTQEEPLRDILPAEVHNGEIIEIDDGLQPYYFYVLDYATIIPLTYFSITNP